MEVEGDTEYTAFSQLKLMYTQEYLDVIVNKDKPYYTLGKMETDANFKEKVTQLLDSLLDSEIEPPENCIRWEKLNDIEKS